MHVCFRLHGLGRAAVVFAVNCLRGRDLADARRLCLNARATTYVSLLGQPPWPCSLICGTKTRREFSQSAICSPRACAQHRMAATP